MNDISNAGIAMTVFGRDVEQSLHDLAGEALKGALKDPDCQAADVGVTYCTGMTDGSPQGQLSIPGQVIFSKIGIAGIPVLDIVKPSPAARFSRTVLPRKPGMADRPV